MAVGTRRPAKETIQYSDHGGQLIDLTFGRTCHTSGQQSMAAVGSSFDNAVAETAFAPMTEETLLHDAPEGGWPSGAQLRAASLEYIEGSTTRAIVDSTLGALFSRVRS